ncbi:MAG: acyl-ACP--UDP-N-acetylglucosamine O-acyltransferase [Pseudomonadales bacterium]|nr:acyl-ACP--UDP-N-acetylglucosamine O-acyltransferase [Pseudomonadales bacterium]
MSLVDPRAIIDPSARLAEGVSVGPWSIIGPDVEIGENTEISSHVVIRKSTRIGRDNKIFQFASVGEDCQDKKYNGEETFLEIGDRNVIREGCTLNRGTTQDAGITRVGSDNLLMAYVHIPHDCIVGDHCILANNAALAGHVQVGDWAILGGYTLVHQFCKIGAHSFCGTGSVVLKDVPAYVTVNGNSAIPRGTNSEGLKRRGFSAEAIAAIKRAYRITYRSGLKLDQALEELDILVASHPEVALFIDSLRSSTRGIVR